MPGASTQPYLGETSTCGSPYCIVGPTGFWFHNHTTFQQQVSSGAEVTQALSLHIFLGERSSVFETYLGIQCTNMEFSHLVPHSFLSSHCRGVESFREEIIAHLHLLRDAWSFARKGWLKSRSLLGFGAPYFLDSQQRMVYCFPLVFRAHSGKCLHCLCPCVFRSLRYTHISYVLPILQLHSEEVLDHVLATIDAY